MAVTSGVKVCLSFVQLYIRILKLVYRYTRIGSLFTVDFVRSDKII